MTHADLNDKLLRIDNRGYNAYKDLRGSYEFPGFTLMIDHVQGDPFASPSRLRVRVSQSRAQFPEDTFYNRSRKVALEDYLTRAFANALKHKGRRSAVAGRAVK